MSAGAFVRARVRACVRVRVRVLRRSIASVVLNLAEGSGSHGGTRRARYSSALGSARESLANLDVAEALGYDLASYLLFEARAVLAKGRASG